jgi:hypothetical protein
MNVGKNLCFVGQGSAAYRTLFVRDSGPGVIRTSSGVLRFDRSKPAAYPNGRS